MAEMTMLLAAIYRKYTTRLHAKQENASPGITSRFEVFGDETTPGVTVSPPSPFKCGSVRWLTYSTGTRMLGPL